MSDGDNNTKSCYDAHEIDGIVSNATRLGLLSFSNGYAKVHGYVAIGVCLFGILTNLANVIVLTRKNMISSINTILLWLAISDLLTMLDYLPFATHFYVMKPDDMHYFTTREFSWIIFLMFHASFSIVTHTIAIWLTIALAIFRYIYICLPTRGSYYCSIQRARYVVSLVIILASILLIPNYITNTIDNRVDISQAESDISNYNVSFFTNGSENATVDKYEDVILYYPKFRENNLFFKINKEVNFWIQAILFKLLPCLMLTVLTLMLLQAMHKAHRKRLRLRSQGRKGDSDKQGEHNRTSVMLLVIVILFTLTELPQGILTLLNIFFDCHHELVYNPLGDLNDIMALAKCSVNFIFYCTMSTQFRNTFFDVFWPKKTDRNQWLKMGPAKSRTENKYRSMEVSNKNGVDNKYNNNGQTAGIKPTETESEPLTVCNDFNKTNPNHDSNVIEDVQANNDSTGIFPRTTDLQDDHSAHTHGFSSDHSHV